MTETLTIARVGAQGDGIAETPGGPVFGSARRCWAATPS